jgi:hypothetical protein
MLAVDLDDTIGPVGSRPGGAEGSAGARLSALIDRLGWPAAARPDYRPSILMMMIDTS